LLKVVIDTNIFISGILTEGSPYSVIRAWKRGKKYQLFITEEIISEILKVMKRLKVDTNIIADWNKLLQENATLVRPARKINVVTEDTSDNKFLECAVECNADYIVTGDQHLKKLRKFDNIPIVTPSQFLNIIK
jgi:uncharacterized protein